jgi:hypothetical protein
LPNTDLDQETINGAAESPIAAAAARPSRKIIHIDINAFYASGVSGGQNPRVDGGGRSWPAPVERRGRG